MNDVALILARKQTLSNVIVYHGKFLCFEARCWTERVADCKLPNILDKDDYTHVHRPQKGIVQSFISSLFQKSNDIHIISKR